MSCHSSHLFFACVCYEHFIVFRYNFFHLKESKHEQHRKIHII